MQRNVNRFCYSLIKNWFNFSVCWIFLDHKDTNWLLCVFIIIFTFSMFTNMINLLWMQALRIMYVEVFIWFNGLVTDVKSYWRWWFCREKDRRTNFTVFRSLKQDDVISVHFSLALLRNLSSMIRNQSSFSFIFPRIFTENGRSSR